jgi:hypothetical protein
MAMTRAETDVLEQFETLQSDDEVKTDLELTCRECGEHVCDVEHGDTLGVLVRTADGHMHDKHPGGGRSSLL